ncbi:TPA: hypothetical protein I8393_002459 [Serratia marcescens]|uniref:hypothetical protein n=1 Tax=Serratia marcescens TaxID=615 RepID=UPI001A27A922|nr:hypothetical protein [Serratia marcescens]MDP8619174.1 hypothetical protein [Serratia marcescens]HAT2906991.1 hypothetical protein [Serratia marcescens]HAU5716814.1 hypothetical protein [Serratia marcescens]HAU5732721.1 hypothetical protein [Serratia marcescens]HAU5753272.1 hypothetical protein [Serratia marcescens]
MRPSDLVREFGNPVAYYPGLVKHMGSVNAVVLFCQFFYWTGKETSELGIYKTTEEIEVETGLTYEEQLNARKKLKRRGVLVETNKRLEHKIYYRIDTDKLDEILAQAIDISPNGQSPIRETGKAHFANTENPDSPARENPVGGDGKAHFDPTENTTKITTEKKPVRPPAAPSDQSHEESLKIDYDEVLRIFRTTLPELPDVLKMTDGRRKALRKLWKDYEMDMERWGAYLRYISKKCRWMLEDRPDTNSGKTWRKKDFDYLITEKCYLKVKEERADDLPKVQRQDSAAREEAYVRLVSQRQQPRNEVEKLAKEMAGSLGRMTDYDARRAWTGIWAQAVAKASENDLARIA